MKTRHLVVTALVLLLAEPCLAATRTWTGTNSGSWSDPANWGGTAPVGGDALVFPEAATNRTMTNDLSSPYLFLVQSLAFQSTSAGYVLGGAPLGIGAGGISTSSLPAGASHSITLPLVLFDAATPFAVGGWLKSPGEISGSGGFTKTGSGRLSLSGTNTYAGTTTVSAGYLEVTGFQPGSPVVVNASSGTTGGIWGTGTVGPVTVNAGSLSPSPGWVGILHVAGNVAMSPAARMYPVLGFSPNDSKLVATGGVAVSGALNVNLNPLSTIGTVYTLVSADGGVTGTFNGVPEGGTVVSTGGGSYHRLQVSYAANGGKTVTLTDLGIDPRLSLTVTPAAPCPGELVTFTATVLRPSTSNPFATGSVVFRDGPLVLGNVALNSSGVATLTTTTLTTGSHAITADYSGDALYLPGTAAIPEGYDVGLLPSPFVVAPVSIGSGQTGAASVAPSLGSGFSWTITNGTILSGNGTNQIAFTAGSEGAVSLTVIVSAAGGCTAKPGFASVPIQEAPTAAVVNRWLPIGADGGDVLTLVADPSDPSTLWVGTKPGAFKSTDGGGHWKLMFSSANFAYGVGVDPTDGDVVLVSDRNRQIHRTTDGGVTWALSSSGIASQSTSSGFGQILYEPGNPSVVYYAWQSGLFKSTDSGHSWTAADSGPVNGKSVTSLSVHPSLPGHLYLATSDGLFRSEDGGATWVRRSSGLPYTVSGTTATQPVSAFAVNPTDWQTIYAGASGDGRVYASTDGGGAWTPRTAGAFRVGPRALVAVPGTSQTLYAAKSEGDGANPTFLSRIYRSTDGGATWSRISDPIWGGSGRPLAAVGASPALVFAVVGGVLWKFEDGGGAWTNVTLGLRSTEITLGGIAFSPSSPTTAYVHAGERGMLRTTDGGATFSAVNQNVVYPVNGSAIVAPGDPHLVLAAGEMKEGMYYGSDYYGFLARSTDGGATWSQTQTVGGVPTEASLQPWGFVALPTTPATFFVAGASDGVYKSTDGGITFTEKNTGLPAGQGLFAMYYGLASSDLVGSTLYVAVSGSTGVAGVYKTTNGGDSWTLSSTGLPAGASIRGVAVHPAAPQRVFAAVSGAAVHSSTDGGATWAPIPGGLSGSQAVAIAPGDANTIVATGFASNAVWVSRSTDGGATWNPVTLRGLDLPAISNLAIDPSNPNRIFAGGRGGISTITLSSDDPDGDGVLSSVESQVPSLGSVGTGDGNGDGIADEGQAHVASLPGTVAGEWVTMAAPGGVPLDGVASMVSPAPGSLPAGVTLPAGAAGFSLSGIPPGTCTAVTLYFPKNAVVNGYMKYGPTSDDTTPHWYPFSFDGYTGAEVFQDVDRTRVVLHLCDGRRGDGDVVANGVISSLGGPAVVTGCSLPATPVPTNDGPACEGGTIQLSVGLVGGVGYSWAGPKGFTSTEVLPTLTNVTPAMAGDYFVTLTDGICSSVPEKTTVVVHPAPAVPVITAPAEVVPNTAFTASVPENAGSTFAWTVLGGSIVSGESTAQVTVQTTWNSPVTLKVVETSAAGCSSAQATKDVDVVLPEGSSAFYALTPCRVVNTRRADYPTGLGQPSIAPTGGVDRLLPLTAGTCGIPATATAVALNVTVADTQGAGYLTLYPGDGAAPATSTINFALGQVKANNVFLLLATDGSGTIKVKSGSTGALNLLIDVVGYLE